MPVNIDEPLVRAGLERVVVHAPAVERLRGQRLLITGATGFFGKWLLALIDLLNEKGLGIQVTALSRSPDAFLEKEPYYRNAEWLRWITADCQELHAHASGPFDSVIHAATDTSANGQQDGLALFESMLGAARSVLDTAVGCGVTRVLFTGSGAQYGSIPAGTQHFVDDARGACDSTAADNAYGEGKRVQEMLAALYARRHGLEVVFARCFAFVGPGLAMDGHFAIGNLIRDALVNSELRLSSTGEAQRSYLYAPDLAVWLLGILACGQSGQAYNVGSDQALSIADLARQVAACVAPDKPVVLGPQSSGPRSVYVPAIDKARALGLDVWTPLHIAIKETAQWAASQQSLEVRHGV
jgi:nucleoside-diphosphate-sugar epimerase